MLMSYVSYSRGNIDENEIVKIKIFTNKEIGETLIKQINKMPFYKVQELGKIKGWKIQRLS